MNPHFPIVAVLALASSGCLFAYKDAVRYSDLEAELQLRGVSLPNGSGVGVTQVEAPATGGGTNFLPNSSNAEFSGKTITDQNGNGTSSSHATTVGKNLYGTSTSMAGGITAIDVYLADDWLNTFGWYSGVPAVESNPLQNHSWVTWTSSSNATVRIDFAAERDGFLPITALYNSDFGSQTIPYAIPDVYAGMYNGISVGVSDGTHRTGTTSYDGSGRTKPEIVAPNNFTSFATPYVTAAAALLIDQADSNATAQTPLVVKATLLAAADKNISADWDQTATRPIDEVYGAGELDVYEAYFIQDAGQQSAGSVIKARGWNLANLGSNSSHDYTINVPAGFELRNLSSLVTWNREVTYSSRRGGSYASSLADLSLALITSDNTAIYTSDSTVDNLEHIWRDANNSLSAGTYTLRVATDDAAEYAIAWRSELYQDFSLWSSANFSEATPVELRDDADDPDGDGIPNRLEQAFGGDPEVEDTEILPVSQNIDSNGQRYLQIAFRRPSFENGLNYSVETVTDLNGTWTSAASAVELVQITSEGDTYDRYTYRRIEPQANQAQAFLRVVVTPAQ